LCKECAKALSQYELIGLETKVVKSPQKELVGLKGKISDESLKTLTISTAKGEKVLNKAGITIEVSFPGKKLIVQGRDIIQRPHERLKKLWKKM